LTGKANHFEAHLDFLRQWKVYVLPRLKAQQQAQPKDSRLNGSALALQAAFADIDIRKDGPVYYWLN